MKLEKVVHCLIRAARNSLVCSKGVQLAQTWWCHEHHIITCTARVPRPEPEKPPCGSVTCLLSVVDRFVDWPGLKYACNVLHPYTCLVNVWRDAAPFLTMQHIYTWDI